MKTTGLVLAIALVASSPLALCGRAAAGPKKPSYSLGKLRQGMTLVALKKLLGRPKTLGKAVFQGATGEYVRDARWPARGLTIGLAAGKATGPWKVASIEARKPCTLKTARGIGIGFTRKRVERAYKKHDKQQSNADQYVVGSIYGGLIFRFAKQRVTSIFIGAAAE